MDKYRLEATADPHLFRIVATRAGAWGPVGTRGGLVSGPEVLAQDGECWIGAEAVVRDSVVRGRATVFRRSRVAHSVLADDVTVWDAVVRDAVLHDTVYVGPGSRLDTAALYNTCYVAPPPGGTLRLQDTVVHGDVELMGTGQVVGCSISAHYVGFHGTIDLCRVDIRGAVLGRWENARIAGVGDWLTVGPLPFLPGGFAAYRSAEGWRIADLATMRAVPVARWLAHHRPPASTPDEQDWRALVTLMRARVLG